MSRSYRSRHFWSVYFLGMLTIAVAAVAWNGLSPRPAYAQLPDSGAQRNELIAEQRATNQRLTEILAVLKDIRDQGVPGKTPTPAPPGR